MRPQGPTTIIDLVDSRAVLGGYGNPTDQGECVLDFGGLPDLQSNQMVAAYWVFCIAFHVSYFALYHWFCCTYVLV